MHVTHKVSGFCRETGWYRGLQTSSLWWMRSFYFTEDVWKVPPEIHILQPEREENLQMEEKLREIRERALAEIAQADSLAKLNDVRVA